MERKKFLITIQQDELKILLFSVPLCLRASVLKNCNQQF